MSMQETPSQLSPELLKPLPPESLAAVQARAQCLSRARPDQVTPPGNWPIRMAVAGRGWGKTRTGAEDVAWFGAQNSGARIAIIAPTFQDAGDTCVEGESGLLAVLPKICIDTYNRSLGELIMWNQTRFKLYSATEPERLRGPQHHRAWRDEIGSWPDPLAFDQMLFGLRLGQKPQAVLTTTPSPTHLIRKIARMLGVMVTRGSTFDNAANLPEGVLTHLRDRYEGTRLGRQELYAELLEEVQGALWTAKMIDATRVRIAPDLQRVVASVCQQKFTLDQIAGRVRPCRLASTMFFLQCRLVLGHLRSELAAYWPSVGPQRVSATEARSTGARRKRLEPYGRKRVPC